MINGRGSQLWKKEELAAHWDMETTSLGYAQTGMSMDDKTAVALRMPGKELLLDYARRAFAVAQRAVERISDKGLSKNNLNTLKYDNLVLRKTNQDKHNEEENEAKNS